MFNENVKGFFDGDILGMFNEYIVRIADADAGGICDANTTGTVNVNSGRRALDANVVRVGDVNAIQTIGYLAIMCASGLGRLGVTSAVVRKDHD
jgi:hypothetical protein